MKAITELHKILSVLIITLLLAAAIPGLEETTQETAEETDNIITEEHDATSEETPAGKDETEEQKKDISEETIEETTQETIEEINPIQRQDEYEHKKKEGNETTKDVNDTHINQDTEIEHTLNTTDKDAIYVDIEEVEELSLIHI